MVKIGDGLDVMVKGLDTLSADEIKKRLRFLRDDELRLFSNTRDADFDEYDAIERAMDRNRQKQRVLVERLKEIQAGSPVSTQQLSQQEG
jgi:SOS-response transcriptional repressor LexA